MKTALRFISCLLCGVVFSYLDLEGQTISVQGRVVDAVDESPLGYAAVSLYQQSDSSFVSASLADSTGDFVLSKLKVGVYYLEVRFLAYESQIFSDLSLQRGEVREL
ncbi:MAG: carboxypeptidase-like regulatory domain-containing protein, partial [Bacteroidota bacterium]